ncbi:MAG: hypothetical protein LBK63_03045 [Treponema sp.]|jgi:hypothetical protein|nr:hypothetical protein [Treponema sp.]
MAGKAYLTGMLGVLLVFITVLAGCLNSNSEPSDTWTTVSDARELAGTWKGKGNISISAQDVKMGDEGEDGEEDEGASLLYFPASSMGIEMAFDYVADAPSARTSIKMDMSKILDETAAMINSIPEMKNAVALGVAMSIAMDEKLSSTEQLKEFTTLGITQTDVDTLTGGGEDSINVLTKIAITKDHIWLMMTKGDTSLTKYSFTSEDAVPKDELLGAGGAGKSFINQDGTKLKLTMSKAQFKASGISVERDIELILNKQSS